VSANDATVRFEVRVGMRRISCRITDDALDAVSGLTGPSTAAERRKSFDRFRTLIDTAAALKSETMPPGFSGPLSLTAIDLKKVPPVFGVPVFGSSARTPTRPADAS